MDQFATDVRLRYLAVSGGFLGDVVISISKFSGAWDPLVLFILSVIWYQVVRTSAMEVAMMFGLYVDGIIPLQYYIVEGSYALHKEHIDDYWPLFLIGTLIEVGAYFLLDPEPFTSLVCLKSLVLAWIWLGRNEKGVFLSTAIRKGKDAKPSSIPVGGVDWVDTNTPPPFPTDSRYPTAARDLAAKYPDPWCRLGMMHKLKRTGTEDGKEILRGWLADPPKESRAKRFADEAKADAFKHPPVPKTSSSGTRSTPTPPNRPDSTPAPRIPIPSGPTSDLARVRQQLKNSGLYDSVVRDGMVEHWRADRDRANAENSLKRWLTEKDGDKYEERKKNYGEKGRLVQQWRDELQDQRVPVYFENETEKWNKMLRDLYPDPWVRYGMITSVKETSGKKREARIKDFATKEELQAARTDKHGAVGERIRDLFDDEGWHRVPDGFHSKEKPMDRDVAGGDKGGKALSKEKLSSLRAKLDGCSMREAERAKIIEVFSRPRCQSQEAAALARLEDHKIQLELDSAEKAAAVKRVGSS